jgi:hypothetical protein
MYILYNICVFVYGLDRYPYLYFVLAFSVAQKEFSVTSILQSTSIHTLKLGEGNYICLVTVFKMAFHLGYCIALYAQGPYSVNAGKHWLFIVKLYPTVDWHCIKSFLPKAIALWLKWPDVTATSTLKIIGLNGERLYALSVLRHIGSDRGKGPQKRSCFTILLYFNGKTTPG